MNKFIEKTYSANFIKWFAVFKCQFNFTIFLYRFLFYAFMFGEFGWVETYGRMWTKINNLTLLGGYLCKNLGGKKNFLQR